jgi:hypothetical protein
LERERRGDQNGNGERVVGRRAVPAWRRVLVVRGDSGVWNGAAGSRPRDRSAIGIVEGESAVVVARKLVAELVDVAMVTAAEKNRVTE